MARIKSSGNLDPLLHAAEPLVVPSSRAASAYRSRYSDLQRQSGNPVWRSPAILSWQDWLTSLWSGLLLEGTEDRVLLNHLQDAALWTSIIGRSAFASDKNPAAIRELVALSQSGLEIAAAYCISDRLHRTADTTDARAFAEWASDHVKACELARCLSSASLELALSEHLRTGALRAPPTLFLAGFERFTPLQERLLGALEESGCTLQLYTLQGGSESFRGTLQVASSDVQLEWAARWLRHKLESSPEQPPALALILPDYQQQRAILDARLRETLAPELQNVGAGMETAPWLFGTGPVLDSQPVIQHALLLLRWFNEALSPEQVTTLLLSPYLHSGSALEHCAQLDVQLRTRSMLRPELDLPTVLKSARKATLPLPALETAQAHWQAVGLRSRSYADWAEVVRKLLRSAGWPGPRDLDAGEQAATDSWDSLLDLCATLDLVQDRTSLTAFVALLRQEASTLVVAAGRSFAPVQILSPQEAEGCSFDAAIWLDATDQQLPAPVRLHPLLSWSLQRQHSMPGTSAQDTCTHARDALMSLALRCRDLILVSPVANEMGPLRPSPLISEIGCVPLPPDQLLTPKSLQAPVPLRWVPDSPALPALPSQHVAGGARVLELQAACGFRAFAALRLNASSLEQVGLGLDARRSGNVLHRAMDAFWAEVQSQERLRELGEQGRSAPIRRAVAHALAPLRQAVQQDAWTKAYLAVVQQRFEQLLWSWLSHELARGPFIVQAREKEQLIEVGPLALKVRPDRIDQAADGLVFIDYKSSSRLRVEDWLGDRPELPQLPLYTLLHGPDQVRGVAFAKLRAGKGMGWEPLQTEKGLFPKARLHDLSSQHDLWKTELERLAESFASGDTRVAPKDLSVSCAYCDCRLLCRVDPAVLHGDEVQRATSEDHDG